MIDPDVTSNSEYVALGLALKALRRRAGLTQVEAAEKVEIKSTFVSQIERGQRGMRWHTLRALLRAYHADLRLLEQELVRAERES